MDITDEQWNLIKDIFPPPAATGRPRIPDREVLNGILWVLRTGAPWKDLPDRYPSHQTCHRRFQQWQRQGLFAAILVVLAEDLRERGGIDLSECFIDGSFSGAKKGAMQSALRNAVKAVKSWRSRTAMVFLSPYAQPALRLMRSPSLRLS